MYGYVLYIQLIQTTPATPGDSKTFRWPAIRQGEEMIREEDKPAWRNFWLKVVPFLIAVVAVSVQCWGGK